MVLQDSGLPSLHALSERILEICSALFCKFDKLVKKDLLPKKSVNRVVKTSLLNDIKTKAILEFALQRSLAETAHTFELCDKICMQPKAG